MADVREAMARRVSELVDGRPVRWANPRQVLGDFDGPGRTLEVFNADVGTQRELLRRLRPVRQELESAARGSVVIVFHTSSESARVYAAFVEEALRAEVAVDVAAAAAIRLYDVPQISTDLPLQKREDDREGSRTLPRTAKAA